MRTKLYFIAFLALVFTSQIAQSQCLKAWYKLDGNGDDFSGNNYHGTVTGTTLTTGHDGTPNSAMFFDGINDKIDLPSNFDYPNRTLSLWFKADLIPYPRRIVYACDNGYINYGITAITVIDSAGVNRIAFHGAGSVYHYTNDVTIGTWYHVALVISTDSVKCYVNGTNVHSIEYSGNTQSFEGDNYAKIGASRVNAQYFNGSIDEVKIFDCALNDAEVYNLYNGQTDCLKAWYKLDGNGDDFSGNNYDGTVTGTTLTAGHDGTPNSAMFFDGINDKIDLPSNFDYPNRTLSLWFKADLIPYPRRIVYACDNGFINYGITAITVIDSAGVNRIAFHGAGSVYHYTNDVTIGTWYHVALVISTDSVKCYVNGTNVHAIAYSGNTQSFEGDNYAKIGASRVNEQYFNGTIDEVKIFDCALSDEEIGALLTSIQDQSIEFDQAKVYPNPTSNSIFVETAFLNPDAVIDIYNLQGQLLFQKSMDDLKTEIDVSTLCPGVYIVKLRGDNQTMVTKLIKE